MIMLAGKLQIGVAITVGIITIGGAAFGIEKYFGKQKDVTALEETVAKADGKYATVQDVAAISKTVILNSLENAKIGLQNKIWALQDRFAKTKDEGLLRIIKSLQDDLRDLEDQIRNKRNE